VGPSGSLELGWYPTTLTADGAVDPVTGQLPPEFVPLHWHGDAVTLPDDATLLASSEQTRVQAFRHGRAAYGLLFHLEADVAQVAAMATQFPDEVARAGSTGLDLADSQRVAAIEAPADRFFDAWVALTA
jgi:GMP synthase (glutamine-hydrolysing)